MSLGRQLRIWPLSKLGSQDPAQASRLLAVPRQLLPRPLAQPGPSGRGGEGAGYSPCRERSSKGARREPGEVIPGPQGARPPPARPLVAAAEARAGPSAPWGPLGAPRPAAPQQSSRRGWDPRTPHEASAAPAPPRPRRLSCDEGRPGLAASPHSATATTSRCPRTRRPSAPPGSHSPQLPASYSGCSGHRQAPRRPLAPLGLPGNCGSSATPGGPPAERAPRAAGAAAATCARGRLLPRTPPRAPGTQRPLPSSPTVGPLSCSKPLLRQVVSVFIPREPLEGLFHRLRLNQQDSFL